MNKALLISILLVMGCGHTPKFRKATSDKSTGYTVSGSSSGRYSGRVVVSKYTSTSQGAAYAERALAEVCFKDGKPYFLIFSSPSPSERPEGVAISIEGFCAPKNEIWGVGLRTDEKGNIVTVLNKKLDIKAGDTVMTVDGSPFQNERMFDLMVTKAALNKRGGTMQLDIGRGETFRRLNLPFMLMKDVLKGPADLEILREDVP